MWTGSRHNCTQASACGLGQGITVLRLVHVDGSRYNCTQASACGLGQGIITVLRLVHVDWVKV